MTDLTSTLARLFDVTPTVRLGITGLSRAGKTVFITALVRNLVRGGRLPFFAAASEGRLIEVNLVPQADDRLPRFEYEAHLARLAQNLPEWPEGTRRISALRLAIRYEPVSYLARQLGAGRLNVDLIDYPGEWLIDLGLMEQTYSQWSAAAMAQARTPARSAAAAAWLGLVSTLDPRAAENEPIAIEAAEVFTAYLAQARADGAALSTLSPGRFLMPGDLAGSPLLTFAPLDIAPDQAIERGSLAAMMVRRFESYKMHVVKPFFRDHFARLDRQIVLVDALAALNGGPDAVNELTAELARCLRAFRPGHASWLASLLGQPRVERVLFAATKADHLHQSSHDRLEAALRHITAEASARAEVRGASVGVLAIAALRSTRETEARQGGERLPCIAGVPLPGETVDGRRFDGRKEAVVFPGDVPLVDDLVREGAAAQPRPIEIVRFRPVRVADDRDRAEPSPWPHVRLDRAIEFLLGDRLA